MTKKTMLELLNDLLAEENINEAYFHHNYHTGRIELNIDFVDSDKAREQIEKLYQKEIPVNDKSAFWE